MNVEITNGTTADHRTGIMPENIAPRDAIGTCGTDPTRAESESLPMPTTQEHADHQLKAERLRRLMDPEQVARWEADAVLEVQEIERGIMFHLADLLALANFSGIHRIDDITRRAIRLLKPFAPHSRRAETILHRLCQAHGQLRYIPKDHTAEDAHEVAPDVLVGRLRERQQFLTQSTLSDLRSVKKWAAEARRVQRQAATFAHDPASAA